MSDRPFLDILAIVYAFKAGTEIKELANQYGLTVLEVEGIIRVFMNLKMPQSMCKYDPEYGEYQQ